MNGWHDADIGSINQKHIHGERRLREWVMLCFRFVRTYFTRSVGPVIWLREGWAWVGNFCSFVFFRG